MTYQGYMALANDDGETIELVNAARVKAYTDNLAPSLGLRGCDDCEGLDDALGETYTNPTADFAPWYDPTDPATADFYGVYPLAFNGIDDSTRSIESAELTGDGSVVVGSRFTGKDIRVSGMAFAKDEAALYAGVSWLDSALNGTEEGRCFGDRLNLYSSCPPVQVLPPGFAEPYTLERGTVVRQNVINNPRASDTALWSSAFGTGGAGTETPMTGGGLVISGGPTISKFMRYQWTTASSGGTGNWTVGYPSPTYGTALPIGTSVAAIMYVRSSTARTMNMRLITTDGASNDSATSAGVAVPANTWTQIGFVFTTTMASNYPGIRLAQTTGATFAIGDTVDVTGAMVVIGASTLGTYFDGDHFDTANFVYGWVDGNDSSESVEMTAADILAEAAQWTTTSGTIVGDTNGVNFAWTTGDPSKVACREITGLIPGEQYQLRLRLAAFGDYYVSVGPGCAERYENLLPDPRLTATTLSLEGSTSVDTRPSSGSPDGDSFFRREILVANTTSPMFMLLADTGTAGIPVIVGEQYTGSWYARKNPVGGPTTRMSVQWYDSGGVFLSTTTGTGSSLTSTWGRFTDTFTAPASAAYAAPRIAWVGTALVGQILDFAQAQFEHGSTATDYFDGGYADAVWTGVANDSASQFESNVLYETIFGWGTDHAPPTEPTVLDFVARDDSIFLSIQPTDTEVSTPTLNLLVEDALVRRVPHPGVVSFGTGNDAVLPTDGWTHLAPATMTVTWQIGPTANVRSVGTTAQAPSGSSLTYLTTHGVERTLYGLTPGSRYRLMVEFDTSWNATDVSATAATVPVITVTNSDGLVTTYSDDNVGTFQYFRVVEFTATATSSVLRFRPTSNLALGSNGSVRWVFHEYMVEEIMDTDTAVPQPGRFQERTMYQVKASQGPILTNVRTSPCGVMGQITYSLRAGNPFKYRSPIFAGGLPTGTSVEVVDIVCSSDGLPDIVNFAYNPSVETNGTDWTGTFTGTSSASRTASATARVGGFVWRGTATNSPGNRLDSLIANYDIVDVTGGPTPIQGETITVSAYFRVTNASFVGTYDWDIRYTLDAVTTTVSGTQSAPAINVWHRIETTIALPYNVDLDQIQVEISTPAAITQGGGFDMDALMIERGSTATEPFDETSDNVVWSEAANTSALIRSQFLEDISEDPDCPAPPAPPAPPTIDEACITQPTSYDRTVVDVPSDTVPRNLTAYPVITLTAGATAVRQARIRFWANPDNLTIDQLDPCSYDGEIIVSYLAAGATIVIDGVLHEATVSKPGFPDVNGNHLLYGPDGGPVDWPELTGGIPYLVTLELDSGASSGDALMLIDLVVRD